mmetsp:Transcript_24243/g.38029  ORF Transcript_24243/g.38029 Transcript_24243/m.38029 type:complete len:140 (-) Transcript_24243:1310-1729(-)
MSPSEETPAGSVASALFSSDDTSLAEGFRDKVAALHEFFDRDKDGFLNHSELRGLQLLTSGEEMNIPTYLMACKSIGCDPQQGISLDGLRLVYAAEGSNVEEDYLKVFPAKSEDPVKVIDKKEDDDVLEVGEDGVDISG